MARQFATTLLLVVAVCMTGCGTTTPPVTTKCTTANCAGCCSSTGACIQPAQQTNSSCGTGIGGAACRTCLPGTVCSAAANTCVGSTGSGGGGGSTEDAGVCGFSGLPCCGGTFCDTNLTCTRGVCGLGTSSDGGACGTAGQPCCAGSCYLPNQCQRGQCVADAGVDAGPTKKTTGEACSNAIECLDGTCLTTGFPGGVCTKACTTSLDCYAGSQCGKNPTGTGPVKVCLKQCNQPGQAPGGCRAGFVCDSNAATSGVPVCYPPCTSSSCTSGRCDPDGFCCGVSGAACCGGVTCTDGSTCTNRYCSTAVCGSVGLPCCAGNACNAGAVCSGGNCVTCGTSGLPCCANNVCDNSQCQNGTCNGCGQAGQSCCAGNVCLGSNACVGAACYACGEIGQPCCKGAGQTECRSGVCGGGTCTGVGAACVNGTDCKGEADLCLVDNQGRLYKDGYCTKNCLFSSCPLGSACSSLVDSAGTLCFENCVYDGGAGGCRPNYVCDKVGSNALCVTQCLLGGDCPSGRCENGFCCGAKGFKCCATGCPVSGSCSSTSGYCE